MVKVIEVWNWCFKRKRVWSFKHPNSKKHYVYSAVLQHRAMHAIMDNKNQFWAESYLSKAGIQDINSYYSLDFCVMNVQSDYNLLHFLFVEFRSGLKVAVLAIVCKLYKISYAVRIRYFVYIERHEDSDSVSVNWADKS